MKTILVPTDFSATAKNAALYAIAFAKQVKATDIILYNAYQAMQPLAADPLMSTAAFPVELDSFKEISQVQLQELQTELREIVSDDISIHTYAEFNTLTEGIHDTCIDKQVDVIIMGITGGGTLEETLIGSNTTVVAKNTETPVIIVPPKAVFQPIEEIVLTVDLKSVANTTPVDVIKRLLDASKAKLFILHVADDEDLDDDEKYQERYSLNQLFDGYSFDFCEVKNSSFTDAVNDFAAANNADIIINIPKKRSLIDRLFKRSHTQMLAFHSHIPLMVVHD
ncbi:MAG: universal stress protein [Chitinophagaceae bacterium]